MVDEQRLDDLYEIYTRLKEEYEELDDAWHKQLKAEEKQADRDFNNGRI